MKKLSDNNINNNNNSSTSGPTAAERQIQNIRSLSSLSRQNLAYTKQYHSSLLMFLVLLLPAASCCVPAVAATSSFILKPHSSLDSILSCLPTTIVSRIHTAFIARLGRGIAGWPRTKICSASRYQHCRGSATVRQSLLHKLPCFGDLIAVPHIPHSHHHDTRSSTQDQPPPVFLSLVVPHTPSRSSFLTSLEVQHSRHIQPAHTLLHLTMPRLTPTPHHCTPQPASHHHHLRLHPPFLAARRALPTATASSHSASSPVLWCV